MPYVELAESPLLPGRKPVTIYFREYGNGLPLVFLHGGWGYEVYPLDRQIPILESRFRILIPDRTGYGRSMRVESLPGDFHYLAAVETAAFVDALGIQRCALWGHSDGAVIAANMALEAPERYAGVILEAFHFDRLKPGSRGFFEGMMENPDKLSERIRGVLARDHGEEDWRRVLLAGGGAWREIARRAHLTEGDLYGGRLGTLRVPTILIHGSEDPRTEPGELDRVRRLLPKVPLYLVPGGEHCPHAEPAVFEQVNRIAEEFLNRIAEREQR